jgi:outer membrane protein TolC
LKKILISLLIIFFFVGIRVACPQDNTKKIRKLTLDDGIKIALENNTYIKRELEKLKARDEEVKEAFADFLPKFSASYSYTRLSDEPFVNAYVDMDSIRWDIGERNKFECDIKVTQPLFTGFALKSQHELSKTGVEIEKMVIDQTVLEIIKEVKVGYFRILLAQKYLKVSKEAVLQLKSHADDAEKFYQQGMIPLNDLLKSKVALSDAIQKEVKAESDVRLAISAFNTILRLDINEDLDVVDILDFESFNSKLEETIKIALKQRPELKAFNFTLEGADHSIKLAKSRYYPQFTLVGDLRRTGEDADISENDYANSHQESIMLMMNWPFFEWGKTRADVAKYKYERRALCEELKGIEDKIKFEVKKAYLDLKVAQKNIETASQSLDQAKENYRITDLQYKQQMTTSTEVLDARTLLTQAQVNYYNALYGYNIAYAELKRAMGEKDMYDSEAKPLS